MALYNPTDLALSQPSKNALKFVNLNDDADLHQTSDCLLFVRYFTQQKKFIRNRRQFHHVISNIRSVAAAHSI